MKLSTTTRLLAAAAILAATNASFASTVSLGTLTPFTGGDAGEGLDLTGNIIYAFNLGGTAQTVQGVNFAAAGTGGATGITNSVVSAYNYGATVDYGATANDNALETMATAVWYGSNWTFDLAVESGKQYKLQLILQEGYTGWQGGAGRNFDVSVETGSPDTLSLAVDELVLGTETNGASQDGADQGLVYTYTFTAADTSFRVALDDSPTGGDNNAVLAGVILTSVTADMTPPNIAILNPADDATVGLEGGVDLVATFDKIVQAGTSGTIELWKTGPDTLVESFDVTDTTPPGTVTFSGNSVTIDPTADLVGGVEYYVLIPATAVEDGSGNPFAGITTPGDWSFSPDVTAPTDPTVDSPADGASEVSPRGGLTLTFDEDMQKGTGSIVIKRVSDDMVVDTIDVTTANVVISGGIVTIVPTANLPSLTGLYVEIEAGAFEDLAGNSFAGISGSGTWSFTTAFNPLTPFTGGDAGEGLDLSGDIIYAFNLGGADQTVQGVTFVAADRAAPPTGITTTANFNFDYLPHNGGSTAADYGATADDDALESIVTKIWYDNNWTFDLDVVPGTQYQLQLILQEGFFPLQGGTTRIFDISVETASPSTLTLAVDDLLLGIETDGAAPAQPGSDFGLVYTYTFTATDSSFRVALDESAAGALAIVAAVTLENLFVEPLVLEVTGNGANLDFEWNSLPDMQYDLVSSTDPEAEPDPSLWALYDDGVTTWENIPNTGTTTMVTTQKVGALRFFALIEEEIPPLLSENFDAAAALPAGWVSNGPSNGTDWEVGTPSGVASGPGTANTTPNCAGTNIGGYHTENADVSLISKSILIPIGSGATLRFKQFIDTDLAGSPHDLGSVRILDADNADAPIAGLQITGIEGDGLAGWTSESLALPVGDVGGKNIKIEFRFVSNAGTVVDSEVWGGFYIDDVEVTQTP